MNEKIKKLMEERAEQLDRWVCEAMRKEKIDVATTEWGHLKTLGYTIENRVLPSGDESFTLKKNGIALCGILFTTNSFVTGDPLSYNYSGSFPPERGV